MSIIGFANGTDDTAGIDDNSGTNALGFVLTTDSGGAPDDWDPGDWVGWGAYGAFPQSGGMPFALADDSVANISSNGVNAPFASDSLGIIDSTFAPDDEVFGAVDTVNNNNTGGGFQATWTFDISRTSDLEIFVDFAAMGDFETSDVFSMAYSIDGGSSEVLFDLVVDEAGSQTYTMDSGTEVVLNDPLTIGGVALTDELQTFMADIAGTGDILTLTFSGNTNGGSEAVAMDNIRIEGTVEAFRGVIGFANGTDDAAGIDDNSGTNALGFVLTTDSGGAPDDWDPGDWVGWGAYGAFPQSGGMPFALADDSVANISSNGVNAPFASDSLGIIDSTFAPDDEVFGAVDTVNNNNTGGGFQATWTFDISRTSDLEIFVDFAAMGDFETSDVFSMAYSIDGGSSEVLFDLVVDEAGSQTYTMDSGTEVVLNDPLTIGGVALTDELQTFMADIAGTGDILTLTFSGNTNGGSEAVAMDNIRIEGTVGEAPPPDPIGPVVINEIQGSTPFTDIEFIELFGEAGTSLDGYSLIVIESDSIITAYGDIDRRVDFGAGDQIGDDGFYLVGTAGTVETQYGIAPDTEIASNFIENSSYTLALVETSSIIDDNVFVAAPTVIDSVAVVDGDVGDVGVLGAPAVPPTSGSQVPGSIARVEDGVDTDTPEDWVVQTFDLGDDETPGGPNSDGDNGGGGDDPVELFVHQIQGSGATSDRIGETVKVSAVVTSFLPGFDGFYIQEEDIDADADPSTSQGIFVYAGTSGHMDFLAQSLSVGDVVEVTGQVSEFGGMTQISATSIGDVVTSATGADLTSLVTPTFVDLPNVSPTDDLLAFESLEGMLVQFSNTLTITQLFNYERYGEVHLSADGRIYQYTQVNAPDVAGNAAYQEETQRSRIILDDGSFDQNPDVIPFLDVDHFSAGDTIASLTGVMSYIPRGWAIQPTDAVAIAVEDTNPLQETPEDVGGSLKVASFNVLNYFTTLDNGTNLTETGLDPRGANSEAELARQTSKIVAALDAMDADVVGLIEIENDSGAASQALVDALNAVSERTYDFVDTGLIGSDAIKVAFIYDTETVKIADGTTWAVLDDLNFVAPVATVLDPSDLLNDDDPKNRPALAVTFEELATGEQFTAVNNHFKSKGSSVDGEDGTSVLSGADLGTIDGVQPVVGVDDGQGNGSATRESAADQLVDWLATNPTGSGDDDVLILGDLNAYAAETALSEIKEGADDTVGTDDDFTDLAAEFIGPEAYSIRFSGQWGTLDYALANTAMLDQVTGVTEWHINSDLPAYLDYNDNVIDGAERSFEAYSDQLEANFDGTSAARSSDHDPVIVGLNLETKEPELNVVLGTTDSDTLIGTDGADLVRSLGGPFDTMFGGGGADVFEIANTEGNGMELAYITDYEVGIDVIDLGESTVASSLDQGGATYLYLNYSDFDIVIVNGASSFDDIAFV